MPIDYLRLNRHTASERGGKEFRTVFDFELSKTFRYGKSELRDWQGYFRVVNGSQEFHLTTYVNAHFVRRVPTRFPVLDRDLWTKGFQIKDNHMVAIFKLAKEMPHLLMSPRSWLDFAGKERGFPATFNKRYRLWSPTSETLAPGLFPQALLEEIGAQPKLRIEWNGSRLFIEYPYVMGLVGVNDQFEPFADFCFRLMSSSPQLFQGGET